MVLALLLGAVLALEWGRYYPNTLHSCSYPNATRLHFYWGRVQRDSVINHEREGEFGYQTDLVRVQNCARPYYRSVPPNPGSVSQVVVTAAVQSNLSDLQPMTLSIGKRYGLAWGNSTYQVVMFRNGVQLQSYSADSSYALGQMNPVEVWTWGYNTSRLLSLGPKGLFQFGNKTYVLSNYSKVSAISIQFNFPSGSDSYLVLREKSSKFAHKIEHRRQTGLFQDCSQAAYGQLLKGYSYSIGSIRVRNDPVQQTRVRELLSLTPSRKRFSWSFLWDDGFHLSLLARRNKTKAIQILKSWLGTMTVEGWIPREQQRGPQRQFLCQCDDLLVKDNRDGNPPSLLLPLLYLVENDPVLLRSSLSQDDYRSIVKWYEWYYATQQPNPAESLFRWFDSVQSNQEGGGSLNSGLDDFPRVPTDHPAEQLYHIDAQSWMFAFSNAMAGLADLFDPPSAAIYRSKALAIKASAMKYLMDPTDFVLKDLLSNGKGTEHSPHLGYINLLPLAFGMLEPGSPSVRATINLIASTSQLNSTYGLRSLSASSPLYYKTKDAYWRGPIWINLNYLVLQGIKRYYPQQLAVGARLASEVAVTVCGNWQTKGYFYQTYDARSGAGTNSFPFTGWTTTVALILDLYNITGRITA